MLRQAYIFSSRTRDALYKQPRVSGKERNRYPGRAGQHCSVVQVEGDLRLLCKWRETCINAPGLKLTKNFLRDFFPLQKLLLEVCF